MRDPGALPEPRGEAGYNGASAILVTRATGPSANGRRSSDDTDREAAVPENPHSGTEKHADSDPPAAPKSIVSTRGEPRERKHKKRDLDGKPAGQAPAVDARDPDRCVILYKGSRRRGEFQVVVTEDDGLGVCVARSPEFRSPRFGALRRWGAARAAHELVVSRLAASGWWSVDSVGEWYELGFVRARPAVMRTRRSLVTVVREAGRARFVAEQLDAYGNPTPLTVSVPFPAPRFVSIRRSRRARSSLEQLVGRLASEGWQVAAPGRKNWYAISLWRPVSSDPDSSAPRSGEGRPPAVGPT